MAQPRPRALPAVRLWYTAVTERGDDMRRLFRRTFDFAADRFYWTTRSRQYILSFCSDLRATPDGGGALLDRCPECGESTARAGEAGLGRRAR